MKNITLFLLLCFFAITGTGNAKTWIVDNTGSNALADTTTLQAAHNLASAGDTIYVYGSETSYGSLTAIKQLYIFGTGYFLDENPNARVRLAESEISTITINAGSEGLVFSGFRVSNISINTSNVKIARNYINFFSTTSIIITVGSSANNVVITQNYIEYKSSNSRTSIWFFGDNGIISNNFIHNSNELSSAIDIVSNASAEVQNNVIYGKVTVRNGNFRNNILRGGSFTAYNCTVTNNICNSTQFPAADGNKPNTSMTSVFVDSASNSTDGRWQLSATSAAAGAGVDGTDCGMFSTFSGNTPYVLSGLPPIPTIYLFEAPLRGAQNQGLNVTIKVRAIQ